MTETPPRRPLFRSMTLTGADRATYVPPPTPPRQRVQKACTPDLEARVDWIAYVAAGRIGVPAPPPAPGGDHRLAGLEAILGIGRRGRVW